MSKCVTVNKGHGVGGSMDSASERIYRSFTNGQKYVKRCSRDVNENIFSRIRVRMIEKIDNVKCSKVCGK